MTPPPRTNPLEALVGIDRRSLQKLSETLYASPAFKSPKLFATVSDIRPIVAPLDKELLRPAVPKLLGTELQQQFDTVAGHNLGLAVGASAALSASRLGIGVSLAKAGERIAELYRWQTGLTEIAQRWRAPLQRWAGAMEKFIGEQQRLDEQTDAFVRAHGWPVPLNLPFRAYRRIVSLAGAGKREVTRLMQETFNPSTRAFAATADVLVVSPQFESRRPLVRQALAAHRKGQWYLVINALLPLVEGVLVDFAYESATPPRSGRPERAIRQLRKREGASLAVAVETLETLLLSAGANVALFEPFQPERYERPESLARSTETRSCMAPHAATGASRTPSDSSCSWR